MKRHTLTEDQCYGFEAGATGGLRCVAQAACMTATRFGMNNANLPIQNDATTSTDYGDSEREQKSRIVVGDILGGQHCSKKTSDTY